MPDSPTISRPPVAFTGYHPSTAHNGVLANLGSSVLRAIKPANISLPPGHTHFGFVQDGALELDCFACGVSELKVPSGFYFSIPGEAHVFVNNPRARGIIVSARGHSGFLTMGWLEIMGRLRYIDGCTDSLLVPPIKMGDPCLNLLYFPKNTDQTMHTHPSDRIGMILSGYGVCVTEDSESETHTPLKPGMLFCIHAGGRHKFRTEDKVMRVLAYHPDSDFGPTDEVHPMINRTMIDGVSASKLPEIHTASR
jgi:mannose-6-phosphate isomerase-like protein (cupin superfamily)